MMIINETHNLNILVCSLDEKGEIENVYHSFVEYRRENKDKEKKFKCLYEIVNVDTGQIPDDAEEAYETPEEALKDFETFAVAE